MKTVILVLSILATGCTGLVQQKLDRYESASRMAANPEHIKIRYVREGDASSFYEMRCTGSLCENTE